MLTASVSVPSEASARTSRVHKRQVTNSTRNVMVISDALVVSGCTFSRRLTSRARRGPSGRSSVTRTGCENSSAPRSIEKTLAKSRNPRQSIATGAVSKKGAGGGWVAKTSEDGVRINCGVGEGIEDGRAACHLLILSVKHEDSANAQSRKSPGQSVVAPVSQAVASISPW